MRTYTIMFAGEVDVDATSEDEAHEKFCQLDHDELIQDLEVLSIQVFE